MSGRDKKGGAPPLIPPLPPNPLPCGCVVHCHVHAAASVLMDAARAVEEWWLREGMHTFGAAPAGLFMLRSAIEKAKGSA